MAWPNLLIQLSLVVIDRAHVMPVVDQARRGHHDVRFMRLCRVAHIMHGPRWDAVVKMSPRLTDLPYSSPSCGEL